MEHVGVPVEIEGCRCTVAVHSALLESLLCIDCVTIEHGTSDLLIETFLHTASLCHDVAMHHSKAQSGILNKRTLKTVQFWHMKSCTAMQCSALIVGMDGDVNSQLAG